ncbi:hypothetical protein PAAG_03917 [Paracoccidioides lutzii Pb01]|uniref:Uncharacterized protein n=1 Tax=Paracoccidioides lutzii (strain ATCC MYA-826 / Pb01) TaxID=502779 RepID=C1GZH3_PARBA|nr:hypothetical protein PAAG_03917 [Paracoccidioides lutzii Pb01]EEH41996.2 hypothetical protein PAAG_03917 [Paracoccidioides lutzii Pb01]
MEKHGERCTFSSAPLRYVLALCYLRNYYLAAQFTFITSTLQCGRCDNKSRPQTCKYDLFPMNPADLNRVNVEAPVMSKRLDSEHCVEHLLPTNHASGYRQSIRRRYLAGTVSKNVRGTQYFFAPLISSIPPAPGNLLTSAPGLRLLYTTFAQSDPVTEPQQDCASQYNVDFETLDACVNRKMDESN